MANKTDNIEIALVAALGNPGAQYFHTRHNIAWQLLEYGDFAPDLEWRDKFKGHCASIKVDGRSVFFLKPQTFMNRSGESIAALMNFHKIEPEEVLVIHDELELEFGFIGFKRGGGLAGHNGLRSTAACLGTRDFNRLRLGISRPSHRDITSYVLTGFSGDEQLLLPPYLEEAAAQLTRCLNEGFHVMEKDSKKRKVINVSI